MLIKKIDEVAAQPVEHEDAVDVSIRVIFGPADNAPTFAMRVFEVGAGGHTPSHKHSWEHEVLVLSGKVMLVTDNSEYELQAGDAVMVPPGEKHSFRNRSSDKSVSFVCLIPIEYQK